MDNALTRADLTDALAEISDRASQRYLSVTQAAAYVGVGDDSIRRLLSAGRLTSYRPVKGRVVIDRAELDAYVRSCAVTPRRGRGRSRG